MDKARLCSIPDSFNTETRFRRVQGLLIEQIDDQAIVFDTNTNLPYIMNAVAEFILVNTNGENSQERIAEMLCDKFDVDFHQAVEDIKKIYGDLLGMRLITKVQGEEDCLSTMVLTGQSSLL